MSVVQSLVDTYPELGEDGLAADKVIALSEVYRNNGAKPGDAMKMAVADLYQAAPQVEAPGEVEPEAPGEVEPEAPGEVEPEAPGEVEPEAPGEVEPEAPAQPEPDMSSRKANKKNLVAVPSATARSEEPPAPKPVGGRMDAIQAMKARRGQK
jgi:hypothetical protein